MMITTLHSNSGVRSINYQGTPPLEGFPAVPVAAKSLLPREGRATAYRGPCGACDYKSRTPRRGVWAGPPFRGVSRAEWGLLVKDPVRLCYLFFQVPG